ncbi:MAG: amidohydrolase family protein, partial [Longimicrobiales bacterium]
MDKLTQALLTVLFGLSVGLTPSAQAQDVLLTSVQIVDPALETVVEGSVLVQDGLIAQIGAGVEAPEGTRTLDLAGRWVIPGLFDLHTHSFGNFAIGGAPEMLGPLGVAGVAMRAGVVGYLDLFSPEDMILGARDQQRAAQEGRQEADIFAAGPCLTATNGHCSEYGVPTRLVDSPADAREQVGELAGKHPDVVKLVYDNATYGSRELPTVDKATMEAVVAATHDAGLKAVIHVGTWSDLMEAVQAGADAVTHTPGPAPMPAELPALMVERGVVHIPTLAVQSELGRLREDPSLLDRPLLESSASAVVLEGYRDLDGWPEQMKGFAAWTTSLRDANQEAVAALAAAGVTMATGTDGGNPGIFQGYSVHREMELLVEAGLSEWAALAAATVAPAAFLGLEPVLREGSP